MMIPPALFFLLRIALALWKDNLLWQKTFFGGGVWKMITHLLSTVTDVVLDVSFGVYVCFSVCMHVCVWLRLQCLDYFSNFFLRWGLLVVVVVWLFLLGQGLSV